MRRDCFDGGAAGRRVGRLAVAVTMLFSLLGVVAGSARAYEPSPEARALQEVAGELEGRIGSDVTVLMTRADR